MALHKETLPDPLPSEPLTLVAQWLSQAALAKVQPNANAMVLATVDGQGAPSARVVLCKEIRPDAGYITFFTNYLSRKGTELSANARAAPSGAPGRRRDADHAGRERCVFCVARLAEPYRRMGQPAEHADRFAL
jgi:hypothetical protein